MRAIGASILVLVPFLLFGPAARATTWNVPSDFSTIQAGIDAAGNDDTVLVQPGTWSGPGNRNLDFGGKAIVVQSAGGAASTIIDAEGAAHGVIFQSGETSASVLDGFTIQHGYGEFGDNGGGICCRNGSSPRITHCVIRDCQMGFGGSGGGISCQSSSPDILHCEIVNNTTADGSGAGIACFPGSSPTIDDCRIAGNQSTLSGGGGIYCDSSSPSITNTLITGNDVPDASGGGVYASNGATPTFVACTVSGNSAGNSGGAVYCYASSAPSFTRSIVYGNCAQAGREVFTLDDPSTVVFVCSASDPTGNGGAGTAASYEGPQVFTNPRLCMAESCENAPSDAGDYSLAANSPCLPAKSPCGEQIGALGEGCGPTAAGEASWGRLKSRFH